MSEVLIVERSPTLYKLLRRSLEMAHVATGRHFDSFPEALEVVRTRLVAGPLPALLIIGIPDRDAGDCEKLVKLIKDVPGNQLALLLLSHAPMPKLARWLEQRGRALHLIWSQFGQVPAAISELAPQALVSVRRSSDLRSGPVRILLVDDSVSVRRMYHSMLTDQGFEVELAESMASGLSKARGGRYDLILVDYYLPDGTGDELTLKLRADPASRHAQIVLITASYKEDIIQRCLDAGAVECVFKNEVMSLTLARIRALARQVDDRRETEAERQRLDGILRSVGDGVYGLDEEGNVSFINPTGWRMLGHLDDQELIGKPAGQLLLRQTEGAEVTPDDPGRARIETVFLTRDGRPMPVECSVVGLALDAQRRGAVVVFRDISERKSVERVRWELEHDKLTGLSNRRYFLAGLEKTIAARKQGGYSAVLYVDVDRFTQVMENAGEVAAQQLLAEIGQRLLARLRQDDQLARIEHDRFALLLDNVRLENLYTISDGLRDMLKDTRYLSHAGLSLGVTVSIGVAIVTRDSPSAEYVLENARQACGQAKRRGQNQTQIFLVDADTRLSKELEAGWAVRIREAMAEDRLILLAQPIFAIADAEAMAKPGRSEAWQPLEHAASEQIFELLLRLVNRDGQWISPSIFVPLAERANLMPKIDLWVVSRAVRLASRLPDSANFAFTINLSNQTLQDPDSLKHIQNTLQSHRVPGRRLMFEISETGEIQNVQTARRFLAAIKQLGCRIALDDYGSGRQSLEHLKWLPVDMVKVSGESVISGDGSNVERAMVMSLTQMAHVLKLKVIAQRVDSAQALDWLRRVRVDFVQGHLFGEPKRLEDIDFDVLAGS